MKLFLYDLQSMNTIDDIMTKNMDKIKSYPVMLSSPVQELYAVKQPIDVNVLFSYELQAFTLLFTGDLCVLDNPSWRYVVKRLLFFDKTLQENLLNFYHSEVLYSSIEKQKAWNNSWIMSIIRSSKPELLRYTDADVQEYKFFNQRKKRYAELYNMKINSPKDESPVLEAHFPDGKTGVTSRFILQEQIYKVDKNIQSINKSTKQTKTLDNNYKREKQLQGVKHTGTSIVKVVFIVVCILLFVCIIFAVLLVWYKKHNKRLVY
eukprot:GHVR01105333.1.p1 GENE.GHVR01105333.1~~GHVR01105333.1.p1  ORF type:complete len:263 (-),score=40.41 GHVR01105333.1:1072-1860(-)